MEHKLQILDPTGHSETSWTDGDEGGIAVLEATFPAGAALFATSTVEPGVSRKVKSLREVRAGEDAVVVPQIVGG
jgi:hypothetical protein